MQTVFAFVEDCGSFICASCLHGVVLELGMAAVGALILDCHLGLCSFFLLDIICDVFPDPVPIFMDFHVCFDGFSYKFLETELVLAGRAGDFVEEAIEIDETAALGAEIGLVILDC